MKRSYNEPNLGTAALVGRTIKSASINPGNDLVILETDEGPFYLTWRGGCCARCFIANVSGSAFLEGATVLEVADTEWSAQNTITPDDEYGDVFETMGTKIKTTKGYVDLDSRVEHNGYYGGMINVSKNGPVDQYRCLEEYDMSEMKPLEDF